MTAKRAPAEKECTHCHETKPIDQFRNTTLAPDGHANICKGCAAARRLAKKDAGNGAEATPEPGEEPIGPPLISGAAFGFSAQLRGRDVVLQQTAGDKDSTIWLSLHEAADFCLWFNSQRAGWETILAQQHADTGALAGPSPP